jgi:hypothetical protein
VSKYIIELIIVTTKLFNYNNIVDKDRYILEEAIVKNNRLERYSLEN